MSNIGFRNVQATEKLRVHFSVWIPSENGSQEYHASPEELLLLEKSPEDFYAHAHGLTRDQYLDWTESGWSIICSAITKAGYPCTNYVRAGCQVPAREWLRRIGERCASHGG